MTTWRRWCAVGLTCAVALALAAAARHWLIEPAGVSARCDTGAAALWCVVRAWTIQLFVQQRIGWFALCLALLAHAVRLPPPGGLDCMVCLAWLPWAALFSACAGLVLYTTGLCAPAALLALLALVRKPGANAAASTTISRQNASA